MIRPGPFFVISTKGTPVLYVAPQTIGDGTVRYLASSRGDDVNPATLEVLFQTSVGRVAEGAYKAKPARVFRFEQIEVAHRLMESNEAGGKIVIRV